MSHIIIGIHGMGNKPPEKILQAWWKASIREGLQRVRKSRRFFDFELFYWAHYLHPEPLQPGLKDRKHPLYIEEPYRRSNKIERKERPSRIRQRIRNFLGNQLDRIFLKEDYTINHEHIADFIIRHFFSDLEKYYNQDCVLPEKKNCDAKTVICSGLTTLLRKHRKKKILLVAHSMGAIIAYDVLTQYAPEVPIHTFVTIGAPLGLPVIKSKIAAESDPAETPRNAPLRTPENVESTWYNLSDLKDNIAVNYKLDDDFGENTKQVRPTDLIVVNDYECRDEKNPHKAYGYLRTSEMAEIVNGFLGDYRYTPFAWLSKLQRMNFGLKTLPFKKRFRK